MRYLSLIGFALCAIGVGACDERPLPRIGLLNPSSDTTRTGNPTTGPLNVIPNRVQLPIGATYQLATDAPFSLESRVQWRSLNPSIAAVSPSGVVQALAAGSATIIARYSFDTTTSATAVVVVSAPTTGSIGATAGTP